MLQFEELKLRLEGLLPGIKELEGAIGLAQLEREVDELEAKAAAPGFWDNMEEAQKISQRTANLKISFQSRLAFSPFYRTQMRSANTGKSADQFLG